MSTFPPVYPTPQGSSVPQSMTVSQASTGNVWSRHKVIILTVVGAVVGGGVAAALIASGVGAAAIALPIITKYVWALTCGMVCGGNMVGFAMNLCLSKKPQRMVEKEQANPNILNPLEFNAYKFKPFFNKYCKNDPSVTYERAEQLTRQGLKILTLQQQDEANLNTALQTLSIPTTNGAVDPTTVLPQISWAVQYLAAQKGMPYENGCAVIPTNKGSALTALFARIAKHRNTYMRDGNLSSHFHGMRSKSDNQEQHFGYDTQENSLAFQKKHILFGMLQFHNGSEGVFIKIEPHGLKGFTEFLLHTKDFIATKILLQNQGTLGLTPRREGTPKSDLTEFRWIIERIRFEEACHQGQQLSLQDFENTQTNEIKNSSIYGYAYMNKALQEMLSQDRCFSFSQELRSAIINFKNRIAQLDHLEIRKGQEFIVDTMPT